jgi:hypothetical protein
MKFYLGVTEATWNDFNSNWLSFSEMPCISQIQFPLNFKELDANSEIKVYQPIY